MFPAEHLRVQMHSLSKQLTQIHIQMTAYI